MALEEKRAISLDSIDAGKKFEIHFSDPSLKTTSFVRTETYDRGGVRTHYNTIEGLRFSVQDPEDHTIIETLQNSDNVPAETKTIFLENIYKLK